MEFLKIVMHQNRCYLEDQQYENLMIYLLKADANVKNNFTESSEKSISTAQ